MVIIPCRHQPRNRILACIGPPIVGVDAQERIIRNERQRVDQAAACIAQQIPLVRYTHVEIRCRRRKMLLHLLGEVMHIDDNFADARITQMVKYMIEQGNPAYLD